MLPSIPFTSLATFDALPTFRDVVAQGSAGVVITGLETTAALSPSLTRTEELARHGDEDRDLETLRESLHLVVQLLFHNISHALELPWERYLAEMHELAAPSRSVIYAARDREGILSEWSSLSMLLDPRDPSRVTVLFGEALRVFSAGAVPGVRTPDVPAEAGSGPFLVYRVCPNDDVMYTRVAGALMKPLTLEEIKAAKRVGDIAAEELFENGPKDSRL